MGIRTPLSIVAALALCAASAAFAAEGHVLFSENFESPMAAKRIVAKCGKITSPGAGTSRRAVANHARGRYCNVALDVDVRYSEKLHVSFDYRVVVLSGKVPYIGIKVETAGHSKTVYTSANKPTGAWAHFDGPVSNFRLSKSSKKPLSPGERIARFSVYSKGDSDKTEHTLFVDNVRFTEVEGK